MLVLAESFLHHFDPFAIEFPASWPIAGVRWYGLSYAMGFILGWLVVSWMARTRRSTLTSRDVGDMMFAVILGVLVGGRLGYALFYERHLLLDFHAGFPWWGLLEINRGGMASHGGIIGVIIALTIFGRMRRVSILHMLDLTAYVSTIGLCLGRVANFINAELWGRPLPASMQSPNADPPWWSVKYPQQISERWLKLIDRPPMMCEEEYSDLVAASAADFNIHAHTGSSPGDLTAMVIEEAHRRLDVLVTQLKPTLGLDERFYARVEEIAMDTHHALHDTVVAALKPLLTAYYPSQIIQAMTDGPILIGVLTCIWLRPRKPGVIGSWFLIVYAVLRVISEFFRQPDAGVSLTFGLSRGQLLSVLMFVTGCVCLAIASRRDVLRIGGLRKAAPRAG